MKKLMIAFAAAMALSGCATKARNVDIAGMYASQAGVVAIGKAEVNAVPEGAESVAIKYEEDTAWLSPSEKTHKIKIMMTGTNAVAAAANVVDSICRAFTAVAPSVVAAPAAEGTTMADVLKGANESDKAVKLAKVAAQKAAAEVKPAATAEAATDCADGLCGTPCADGACEVK